MAAPEVKPEHKEVGDNPEPLIYKTWVLKVSIHCEACKRKVKRVLKNVEGVYETDIDLKQQKVVVKGNVESETLIKKLLKTGKHAELWPENPDSKGKKKGKAKKDKQNDSESSDESSGQEDDKEKVKFEVQVLDGGGAGKISDGGAPDAKNDGGGQAKPEAKQDGDGQKSGGGSKKKKKKKKKSNQANTSNGNAGGETSGGAPANIASSPGPTPGHLEPGPQPALGPSPIAANDSPPRHIITQYPPHYFTHPLPLYSVRYSTAYATSSQPQSVSYYATPRQYSYAYVHPGARGEIDVPPSYSSPPSDSLEIFSDENPNGCSVV